MPDNDKKAPPPAGEEAVQETPEDCAPVETEEAAPGEEDPVAALETQVAVLKDQFLRALAETENLRQRSRREREDTARFASGPLAKDMIEVADNLSRALAAVPAEAIEADEHLKTLITGIRMTEQALQTVFERHHIARIDPLGERLDPHVHEAIFEIPDPSQAPGTILQVVRAGYRLHDRLLRAAQVGVAKGGPAANSKNNGAGEENAAGERREPGGQVDTSA